MSRRDLEEAQEQIEALKASYCQDLFKLRAFEDAFKPGDARCLKAVRGLVQASTRSETHSDELACINRLLAIATKIEGQEGHFRDGVYYKKEVADA